MPTWLLWTVAHAATGAHTGDTGGTGDTAAAEHSAAPTAPDPTTPLPGTEDTGADVVTAASLASETGGVGCAHTVPPPVLGLLTAAALWRRRC